MCADDSTSPNAPLESDPELSSGARFDDLRAGTSISFSAPEKVLTAHRPEDVIEVLAAVQQATENGRWAYGYLAYEAAAGLDPDLDVHPPDPHGPPLAWFGLTGPPHAVLDLESPPVAHAGDMTSPAIWWQGWTPEHYRRDVDLIRSRIAEGDTYQTNLTVRMHGNLDGDVHTLYRDLALSQRGAYNAFLDIGRYVIASASPELFFERRGDQVLLRPMKGTIGRGRDLHQDRARAFALRSSNKERAENVMIVDLMRNDVARVARTGSVQVPALLTVERYATVQQLTSEVTADLLPGTGLPELFRALFPCGSVTGAPKPSSMALIRELEDSPRGVYCGAIGWVAPPTAPVNARFSVAIRTAVVDRHNGSAVYGTGSGITWSSEADDEHREVLVKTEILHRRHEEFSLFETMRHQPDHGLRNRDRHLRRLADSAAHLDFRIDLDQINTELDSHLARIPRTLDVRVRLRLHRNGGFGIDLTAAPPDGTSCMLGLDDEPVDPTSWWHFHQTSLRALYHPRRDRRPDVDDVILINDRGELTEATRGTLALHLDGHWHTPPLESGCLPGIERGRRLAQGTLREKALTPADLNRAEGIALLSSLCGMRPATLASSDHAAGRLR